MRLYEAERHEALIGAEWIEDRARDAIDRIVADSERSFTPEGLWPIHPLDRSPERPPDSIKYMYHGAAGVIWALTYLAETGAAELKGDYLSTVRELIPRIRDDLAKYPEVRKYMGPELVSYLLGGAGILLLEWKLAPSEDVARLLYADIEARIGDARGIAWGGAGAMLAALFMYERTDNARWKELFLRSFEALWQQWHYADEAGCHLWTSSLYGVTEKRIGAIHGFAANVYVMLRGRHLLAPTLADEMLRRIHETVRATASIEGSYANWPNNVGTDRQTDTADDSRATLQRCAGDHQLPGGISERRPLAYRRFTAAGGRARVGRRSANQNAQLVSRRGGQRLCLPEVVRAHRGRPLAGTRSQICDARHRAIRSRARRVRTTEVLAVDRGSRPRDLSLGLCEGNLEVPDDDVF